MVALVDDRLLEGGLVLGAPGAALALDAVALDGGQHARRLGAAHDGNPAVGPGPEEAGAVGPPAHAVVAGPERAADDHGDLGHLGAGHRGDPLGAVPGNALGLVFAPDHGAGDVLQEQQRTGALARALGLVQVQDDPQYDNIKNLREHAEELIVIIDKAFKTKNRDEWVKAFEGVDIPVGPVNDYADLANDPQMLANDYLVEFDHPSAGKFKTVGLPVRLSRIWRRRSGSPIRFTGTSGATT